MTNDSELTLFRIYNFRRTELIDVTGKSCLPDFGVFLEPIVWLMVLLIASLLGGQREQFLVWGGECRAQSPEQQDRVTMEGLLLSIHTQAMKHTRAGVYPIPTLRSSLRQQLMSGVSRAGEETYARVWGRPVGALSRAEVRGRSHRGQQGHRIACGGCPRV